MFSDPRQGPNVESPAATHTAPRRGSVAIVITTHDYARFLDAALRSALRQSVPADEIIVVDDGSTDHPENVTARFPVVRLIRQPHAGLSVARNTGWTAARSEFVVFLDADDQLLPDALAANVQRLQAATSAGLSYGGYVDVYADAGQRHVSDFRPVENAYSSLLRGNLIGMHGAVMYRRTHLAAIGGFEPQLVACEDYDVYLRLALLCDFVCGPEPLAEYWHHGANMSRDSAMMLSQVLAVLRRQRPQARRLELMHAYREGVANHKRQHAMVWCRALLKGAPSRRLDGSLLRQGGKLMRHAPLTVLLAPLRAASNRALSHRGRAHGRTSATEGS